MVSENSRFCKNCEISFPASISFCTRCGQPLIQPASVAATEPDKPAEKPSDFVVIGVSPTAPTSITASAEEPLGPIGALVRDIHLAEDALPWNAISYAGVWLFLTLTYFF